MTSRVTSTSWHRPGQVVIDADRLVADYEGGSAFPLATAVKKGRALCAFVSARTDEGARAFTESWGFLYWESGQSTTFPLNRFHLQRKRLLTLIDLIDALRQGNEPNIALALRACGSARRRLDAAQGTDPWAADLTEEEKRLVAEGRKPIDVFIGRHLGKQVSTREYAGQLLAEELHQKSQPRFVRENRQSRLEEIRQPRDLLQAIQWSLRSDFPIFHHIVCESCGEDAVVRRSDAVYCSETCGGRARARRFREKARASMD